MKQLNSYDLSRAFWDFAFENPDLIRPIHPAIYFFAIEHCNRLGWKEKFGLPSQMVMEAIGVKNWRTYSEGLNDLVNFGFIKIIEKSKNQYSSNIIAIVNFTKASTKALDKALQKHDTKHSQSIVSIIKPINNKPLNNEQEKYTLSEIDIGKTIRYLDLTQQKKYNAQEIINFWDAFLIQNESKIYPKESERVNHFRDWLKHQKHGLTNNQSGNAGGNGISRIEALKRF